MDRVKVTHTGERASGIKYMIRPGGITYTARGYIFSGGSTNMLLKEEAAVLADLDGQAKDSNGKPVTKVVHGKEVAVKNRDFVTVGAGAALPANDKFDVEGAKASSVKSKEAK